MTTYRRLAVGEQHQATQYEPDPPAGKENGCGSWYQVGETGSTLYPQIHPQELVLKQQQFF
jgi:hypothetical protein